MSIPPTNGSSLMDHSKNLQKEESQTEGVPGGMNAREMNKLINRTVGPFSGKMQSKPGAAEMLNGMKNVS